MASGGAYDNDFIKDAYAARGYGDLLINGTEEDENDGITSSVTLALANTGRDLFFVNPIGGKGGTAQEPTLTEALYAAQIDAEDLADHASAQGRKSAEQVLDRFNRWKTLNQRYVPTKKVKTSSNNRPKYVINK